MCACVGRITFGARRRCSGPGLKAFCHQWLGRGPAFPAVPCAPHPGWDPPGTRSTHLKRLQGRCASKDLGCHLAPPLRPAPRAAVTLWLQGHSFSDRPPAKRSGPGVQPPATLRPCGHRALVGRQAGRLRRACVRACVRTCVRGCGPPGHRSPQQRARIHLRGAVRGATGSASLARPRPSRRVALPSGVPLPAARGVPWSPRAQTLPHRGRSVGSDA